MPDGDCLVALKGLERFDNNHPVVVMIYNGEDVFVRLDGPRCLRGPLSKCLSEEFLNHMNHL
jgi:hypothetical protein